MGLKAGHRFSSSRRFGKRPLDAVYRQAISVREGRIALIFAVTMKLVSGAIGGIGCGAIGGIGCRTLQLVTCLL